MRVCSGWSPPGRAALTGSEAWYLRFLYRLDVRNVSDDKLRRFALSELMEHVVTPRHGSCSAHMSADARTPIGGAHRVNKPHANQPTTGLRRHGSAAAPRRQRGRAGACPASSVAALPSTWRASLGRLASPGTPRWKTVHGTAAAGIVLAPHEAGARTSAGARTKLEATRRAPREDGDRAPTGEGPEIDHAVAHPGGARTASCHT